MMKRAPSLLSMLFKSLLLPGLAAAVFSVLIVYNVVKEEYDELQDIALVSKAHLVLQVVEAQTKAEGLDSMTSGLNPLSFDTSILDADELSLFWVLDKTGHVITQSLGADNALLPTGNDDLLVTRLGYRIAMVSSQNTSFTVVTATPMEERNEAITDVLIGVTVGFALLGLLVAFTAYRAVRRSAAVIVELSREISTKNAHDLSAIDRKNAFSEIEPAIDTIDELMARLNAALEAERAFATNAAHELRTPVAICIAQVQRLQAKLIEADVTSSAAEIESGLKRLTRIVERLLQMSRAQSGLGTSASQADISPIIKLLLRELRDRVPSSDMLVVTGPQGVWMSKVDPDAIGIMVSNLLENALKHGSGLSPVRVDASVRGKIVISNDCAPMAPADLETLKQRFFRSATAAKGFGLGLSIVNELCKQSGCKLELGIPENAEGRGFKATLVFPDET